MWLVDDSTGHRIDCSELPLERYRHDYLWEPGDPVPELEYTEKPDVTAAMAPRIMNKYGLAR